jgi:DNA helicase-2/ATP-dependent DNA helicase PcrA
LEEERRLFYVALTRAKDSLTFSGAENYGGSRAKKASAFIEESGFSIPESSLMIGDEAKRLLPPEDQELSKEPVTAHYDLKRRFSFTQLAAFRKCPLQYKFAHIYRIPVLGSFQKSFGQSVHLAFQRILELHKLRSGLVQGNLFGGSDPAVVATSGGFRATEDEARKIFADSWIDEWYETRASHDEFFAKGKAAMKRFWQECAVRAPDVEELEKPFTLVLGTHSIKGKVDRIDRLPDGTVAVFDYKTGKAKEKLDAEDKEQLYLYQVALEEKGIKVGKLAYLYVLDWIESEVEPLQGSAREKFIEKISERMDGIVTSEFKAKPDANNCKYCDFKNICEFREF